MDSFSRYLKIYFMKTRDEATEKLERFIADIGVIRLYLHTAQESTLVKILGEFVRNKK